MNSSWYRHDPSRGCLILTLHVQPNARKNAFAGPHGDALKVKVAAPAVDNKANAALVDFLSETLAVPKSAVLIRHGATGRRKIVEISAGPEIQALLFRLAGS